MEPCDIMETYYTLFRMIVETPRIPPKSIAEKLGKTGRGRSPSTISHHILKMYEKKISREPIMILKPFRNSQTTAFFCRKVDRKDTRSTFFDLYKDRDIDYVLFLSGDCDFFITTRKGNINLEQYSLEICEQSRLYTPIFTIPHRWTLPVNEALKVFTDYDFAKGKIPREVGLNLQWGDKDWRIYDAMKLRIRRGFTAVAREVDCWPKTVQLHFHKKVLPCCTVGHYFFPEGQDFYKQAFLEITTDYETGFVEALQMLPCTSYVFPLENMLVVGLYHEGVNDLMEAFQNLEETGVVGSYSFYVPLLYGL